MARRYEMITELYERTRAAVTSPQEWQKFLATACRNYKLPFDEQLLLFAQRPDATAVLEIERWNRQFGRWVNRGSTGIAVFDRDAPGRARLKYYFDISDTHPGRFARRVPLWQVRVEHETEITEALENSFGELADKSSFAEALLSAAKNAVEEQSSGLPLGIEILQGKQPAGRAGRLQPGSCLSERGEKQRGLYAPCPVRY